jgi:hypothetical protein
MTEWTLLAVQSIGVGVIAFFFCRSSYRDGYQDGLRDARGERAAPESIQWFDWWEMPKRTGTTLPGGSPDRPPKEPQR